MTDATAQTNGTTVPDLDIQKLHALPSEQQELFLLTFTTDLLRFVSTLDKDGATAHQAHVKRTLLRVLSLNTPAPTRVIRNNVGACFAGIFEKGNRKLLFESINDLVALVGVGNKERETAARHAAIHCLGAIYATAGDSAINLSSLVISSLLKIYKSSTGHAGLRATVFTAFAGIYKGIGLSADENLSRDVWRAARAAIAGDKSTLVQVRACHCVDAMMLHLTFFDNSNDYDRLQSALFKAMEVNSATLRAAAAGCWSRALVKSYSEQPIAEETVRPRKPKRKGTKVDDEDDGIERPDSPAPTKAATRLSFDLIGILTQMSSHYVKSTTSNRARAAVAICYVQTMKGLETTVVENNYGTIASHLFYGILSHSTIVNNRYKALLTRSVVRIVLESVIGQSILRESAQLRAVRYILNDILRDYPQALKERPEPSKTVLTGALSALSSLITALGDAISPVAELCRESLLQVLAHPSYTVQIGVAHCMKAFALACPQHLLSCVTICTNGLTRELSQLSSGRQASRRCLGLANGLASVLSISTRQPLYGSVDVFARVMSQATSLLKSSSSSDLRVSSTQIQVAWILLGGLMSLGPNFVKIHTSQLLLLWKNALPKPLGKDHMSQRTLLELSFLAHVRECALGTILTFLEYNRRLLTVDVTRRIASMLYNTIAFLSTLPARKSSDDMTQRLSPALQLVDYDLMVKRRVLQTLSHLLVDAPQGSNEVLAQSNLLPFIVSAFAAPESYTSNNTVSAAIASSTGAFESVWDVGDNHGFGVSSLVRGFDTAPFPGESGLGESSCWMSDKGEFAEIEHLILCPIGAAREYDALTLYRQTSVYLGASQPPATEVINSAIQLFAILFPLQPPRIQESVIEQMQVFVDESGSHRDQARTEAVSANISVAILGALKTALKETSLSSGELRNESVNTHIKSILHGILISPDQFIRHVAAQAVGRLARLSGNQFTIKEVDELIELIVANREPSARSGSAMALGQIHSQLGGMAAGMHLKKILGVLNSLSSDPHPTVHFWALESISRLSSSAGLNFAPYVTSTLGLMAQLYYSDSHNEETGSQPWSDIEVDLQTPMVIARCIGSLIDVLGPDLQEMTKTRDLIVMLVQKLGDETSSICRIQSLNCLEHLSLYAPNHLNFGAYVRQLQAEVDSHILQIRHSALEGLHNLMRRDSEDVFKAALPGLEDKLWLLLDDNPEDDVVQNIIWNWLQQSGIQQTALWIKRCNTILMKVTVKGTATSTNVPSPSKKKDDFQDEEVAGFAAASSGRNDDIVEAGSTQELLKWQTRTFAMSVLSELIHMVERDSLQNVHSTAEDQLQGRVADVIRIAFSASTTGAIALRIKGLQIINQILRIFSEIPDPEYPDVPLLQQHQAQISSALNPAFGHDSSPELAAEAVNVCATFVAAGIVTEIKQMTRILSLLSSSLDSFSGDSDNASIGELHGLSSNAAVMVRMAIYSAWAELQVASSERKYLKDALKTRVAKLTPLWLASLQEHARLRFEPDISMAAGAVMSSDVDSVYAAFNRQTLLQFYQASWLKLVEAIASLIDENIEFVFEALDGKIQPTEATNGHTTKDSIIPYRNEPVAFFFVLFGLAFESLVGRSADDTGSRSQTLEILNALKKILRPSVSGNAIYQDAIFSETMDMLDRLALTEPLNVQFVIVQIARNLCLEHPSARKDASMPIEEERLSDDIEQLFELTRIIVLVLAGLIPNLTDDKSRVRHALNDEAVALLGLAMNALVDASSVFPSVIETDLHACIIHIFSVILSTPACQSTVVPQSLPVLKRFLSSIASRTHPRTETTVQVRTALARFLTVLKQAQLREMEQAIACEKNALFASTILFSTTSNLFSPSDPLVRHLASELADCLNSRIPSKIASTCAHSVMLSGKRTPADDAFAAAMLPYQLAFVGEASDTEGLDEARAITCRTLTALVTASASSNDNNISNNNRTKLLIALVLPTLLNRARNEGQSSYKDVADRILECAAAASQVAFRGVVAGLDDSSKALLEDVVRLGGGVRKEVREERDEPTIALKMNFG